MQHQSSKILTSPTCTESLGKHIDIETFCVKHALQVIKSLKRDNINNLCSCLK